MFTLLCQDHIYVVYLLRIFSPKLLTLQLSIPQNRVDFIFKTIPDQQMDIVTLSQFHISSLYLF